MEFSRTSFMGKGQFPTTAELPGSHFDEKICGERQQGHKLALAGPCLVMKLMC